MYSYLSQSLTISGALEVQNISGALSGSYSKKHYHITADCSVASGVDVDFAAGSILDFDGDYFIEVIGQIQLNGTSGDRITVRPTPTTNTNNRWRGFRLCDDQGFFNFAGGENSTTNKFTYCDFYNAEKLQESGANYHRIRGAAIFAYLYESLEITNCSFHDCKGLDYGGTIYLHVETGGSTTFANNSFFNCSAQNDSSGCWVFTHGTFSVSNCTYSGSSSGWSDGNAFAFTVNLTTDLFTSGSGDTYSETGQLCSFAAAGNTPAPLSAGVSYPMIRVSSTTWKLASSYANANAGTAQDISGQPSGTKVCKLQVDYSWFDATVTVT